MSDNTILKILSKSFTCNVTMDDIPFIRFKMRKLKKEWFFIRLVDTDCRLGNMWAGIDLNDLYPDIRLEDIRKFLILHGAKPLVYSKLK